MNGFQINSRNDFGYLLNRVCHNGIGVEIGVDRGEYSNIIANTWRYSKYILVDPWKEQEQEKYIDEANVKQLEQDRRYEYVEERFKDNNKIEIIRDFSEKAYANFEDESLDWVYIDANHSYESVKQDIELWYKKVKQGGILSGHDYVLDGQYLNGLFGVKGAVAEFIQKHNLKLYVTDGGSDEKNLRTWYVFKPSAIGNISIFKPKICTNIREKHGRKAVSTLASKAFIPGLEVMIYSLLKHTKIDTKAWELVILTTDLEDSDLVRVKKMWSSVSLRKIDVSKYTKINGILNARIPGANGSYHKFELFGLSEFDKVIALDSDLLFLQDVSLLFSYDYPVASVRELLIDQYNTGVMIIGSEYLGDNVVNALIDATELFGPEEHSDQGIISEYFYDVMTELPIVYNFLKIYYNYPCLHKFPFPSHIKVLHYIIHKPWLWNGWINEIEAGTEALNVMWNSTYNEMKNNIK